MGVAAAFPSVARGCLTGKVRNMGIGKVLVDWAGGFMIDHLVTMSVDSRGREALDVATGLPQHSPISPVLVAIYIAEIHIAVSDRLRKPRHPLHRRSWTSSTSSAGPGAAPEAA